MEFLRHRFTLRRKNLKTKQSPVFMDLCSRKTGKGKSHELNRDVIVFEKLRFQSLLRPKLKRKFLRFEERFRKASFSYRISVDGRPDGRNKALFSTCFFVRN